MNWWVRSIKKYSAMLNYIENYLILASAVTGCVSISGFISLSSIPVRKTLSVIRLKIWATTAGIKKYRSIITKHEKNHDQVWLSAKTKLNTVVFLISKALIYQNIGCNDFVLIKILLKEYDKTKEKI